MIPKIAIKQYLNRPLESHRWIKQLTKAELLKEVASLRPKPMLYKGLLKHQLACFLLGVSYPKFAFWLDMGAMKTLITLSLLRYWRDCGKLRRAVIFITSDKAFPTWEKQIKRFGINVPYTLLEGTSANKWRIVDEFGEGLLLVSYRGALSMMVTKVRIKNKNKWKLDSSLVQKFASMLDAVVMDESTNAGGDSLTFDMLNILCKQTTIHYALAGRPFGRDPILLWRQHFLVDGGTTLGPTLGLFHEVFYTAVKNPFAKGSRAKYAFDYFFKKKMEPELSRMIEHRSITYAVEECTDLPECVPIIEEVSFPEEAHGYYKRAVATIIEAQGNMREMKSMFLRMRQLSSGFVGFKDDETGERAQVEFQDNPKFDLLMELLAELPKDRKACVFYDFTYSGCKIATAVQSELKLNPIWLWSGTKDYKSDLRRFEDINSDCRVAVIQNKVGAFSLDGLQVANYVFIYESPVGCIERDQMERRLVRPGQVRTVFQYDLIVSGSVDKKILYFHKEGQDMFKALLRNPQQFLV